MMGYREGNGKREDGKNADRGGGERGEQTIEFGNQVGEMEGSVMEER